MSIREFVDRAPLGPPGQPKVKPLAPFPPKEPFPEGETHFLDIGPTWRGWSLIDRDAAEKLKDQETEIVGGPPGPWTSSLEGCE